MQTVTLQELANQQARRATQAERRLAAARKENAALLRRLTALERETKAARHFGRYHRYWIRRFTPEQVVELARGLDT